MTGVFILLTRALSQVNLPSEMSRSRRRALGDWPAQFGDKLEGMTHHGNDRAKLAAGQPALGAHDREQYVPDIETGA